MSAILAALGVSIAATVGAAAIIRKQPAARTGVLTLDELRALTPRLKEPQRVAYLPHLNEALERWDITSYARVTQFLAQVLFESDQFTRLVEAGDVSAYEGRDALGNSQAGDAERYKGRGAIQLTGRYNYTQAAKALGEPLDTRPELVATPEYAFATAGWFWRRGSSTDLNVPADAGDLDLITRRINGGTNGLEHRRSYLAKAQAALSHWLSRS
ncbi:hypothetical protein OWM54_41870 [Myxococcus sp. MISCRS1]|uniref:glycoside hydrolase family 19 protein n=1 Tax=Myxococcus sp. MISCRS1 TaxID=2996786 RepID=UPI002271A4C8|nr:glycoside hydrolase family 19 protein [Myxococcus sp. MISCRS1]MCY1003712.1 hypothetical protein [Myxococcus sp. MISCRS1]